MGNRFLEWLERAEPLLLDGGLATELEAQGQDLDNPLWSAALLRNDPQAIIEAHLAYLEAGARCIISASYQASRQGLMGLGLSPGEADRLIQRAVELARQAGDIYCQRHPDALPPLVAASAGPYGAILHDGSEYTGRYRIDDKALRSFHAERLPVLDQAGADVLACETIPNGAEARILAGLLRRMRTPSWVSFACRDGQHVNDGTPVRDVAALFAQHPTVAAIGINCTAPQFVEELITEILAVAPRKAVVVYPNSGERYDASDNHWHGDASPMDSAAAAARWLRAGARIIGGCCRMGPQHISAMRKVL